MSASSDLTSYFPFTLLCFIGNCTLIYPARKSAWYAARCDHETTQELSTHNNSVRLHVGGLHIAYLWRIFGQQKNY